MKLHGTNSAVVKYSSGRLKYQSRERVLSLEQDNAGKRGVKLGHSWDYNDEIDCYICKNCGIEKKVKNIFSPNTGRKVGNASYYKVKGKWVNESIR